MSAFGGGSVYDIGLGIHIPPLVRPVAHTQPTRPIDLGSGPKVSTIVPDARADPPSLQAAPSIPQNWYKYQIGLDEVAC